jgi:hypothetical protein
MTLNFSSSLAGQITGLWEAGQRCTGHQLMSDQSATSTELVEISKLNGSFKKNYGRFVGAYLYLRSIRATRGGSLFWPGFLSISLSAALAWLMKHGLALLHLY